MAREPNGTPRTWHRASAAYTLRTAENDRTFSSKALRSSPWWFSTWHTGTRSSGTTHVLNPARESRQFMSGRLARIPVWHGLATSPTMRQISITFSAATSLADLSHVLIEAVADRYMLELDISLDVQDSITMDRVLRFWFLALYGFGIIGFISNVWRIRRDRPAFEQQIGPLPEVGALVAWLNDSTGCALNPSSLGHF